MTVVLSLLLLRPVKGALIALQWAFRMHGFGGDEPRAEPDPASAVRAAAASATPSPFS
jgi:Protein of unknown function (DUF983)